MYKLIHTYHNYIHTFIQESYLRNTYRHTSMHTYMLIILNWLLRSFELLNENNFAISRLIHGDRFRELSVRLSFCGGELCAGAFPEHFLSRFPPAVYFWMDGCMYVCMYACMCDDRCASTWRTLGCTRPESSMRPTWTAPSEATPGALQTAPGPALG